MEIYKRTLSSSYVVCLPAELRKMLKWDGNTSLEMRVDEKKNTVILRETSRTEAAVKLTAGGQINLKQEVVNKLNWKKNYLLSLQLGENHEIYITQTALEKKAQRERLTQRDLFILERRREKKSYQQIADELGVTREFVRQLKERAYRVLRYLKHASKEERDKILPPDFVFPPDL